MAKGKHLGSFAGGFMEGLLGVMKMQMMQQQYAALQKHYEALDAHYARQEAFEKFKYLHGEEYGKWEAGNRGAAGFEETVGNVPGGAGGVAGNAAEMRDFYVSQGYTPEGAAAIVGNWQQENSLKGGGWGGDKGTSAGGFQWHDDPSKGLYRGTGFMNWAKENNLDVNDPMTSAKYSIIDLKKNYPDLDKYLRTTNNVDEATQRFEKDFEGAGTPAMENRLSAARTVYKQPAKTAAPATATATTKPPPAMSSSGGVPVRYNGKEYDTDKDGNIIESTGRPITTSQADTGRGSYQVAGDVPIGLTTEAAERARKDLEAHRSTLPTPPGGSAADQAGTAQSESAADASRTKEYYPKETPPEEDLTHGPPPQPAYSVTAGQPAGYGPPVRAGTDVTSGEPTGVAIPSVPSLQHPVSTPYPTPYESGYPEPPPVASLQHPISKPYPVPYESGFPEPSRGGAAEVTRPVVGGDERLQPAANANAPAANATPAVALRPEPQAQALPARPGWGLIERPNIDQSQGGRGGGGPSQMGAFDFSTLWRPNPPIAQQRGATPAPQPAAQPARPDLAQRVPVAQAPQPPPRPTAVVVQPPVTPRVTDAPLPPPRPVDTSTPTPVPPPAGSGQERMISSRDEDEADADAGMAQTAQIAQMAGAIPPGPDDMAVGVRKGGPIRSRRRYAAGGNVTRFATGGAAPTSAQLADPGWQNTASTYTLPGNAPFTNQQVYDLSQTINSQPYPFLSPLSPSGSKDLTGFYGAYTPPAPVTPAPAPAPVVDPTVTPISTPALTSTTNNAANGGTTTGAYQLPDVVAPTTTPALDTTQNTTTVNPTPKTPTTIVPNITAPTTATTIDQNATAFKSLNTPSTTSGGNGSGTSDLGGTDYGDTNLNTGSYAGFRRGGRVSGAIPRYATGGNVTRFAAAGTVQPQAVQSALSAALYGPNAPYSQQQVMAGSPTMTVGQMNAANLAALTPDQQAWYNAQNAALLGYQNATQAWSGAITPATGGFGGQGNTVNQGQQALAQNQQSYYQGLFDPNMPATPAPATPAPTTPVATTPAPVVDPTLTTINTPTITSTTSNAANGGTTTGAYQLPDIVAPTSTPDVTTPTTTVNPTPNIPTTTVPNTPSTGTSDIGATDTSKKPSTGVTAGDTSASTGAYAGFRRGGVTRRVTGYDDGGGVSPAPAGMLPGLGGAQPIPPIYYNNATFAPAGAGIGKGVTVNSAPTFVAGAIPTLPMRKGGVVRYADGGAVSDEEMQSAATDVGDDYGEGAAGSTEQQYAMDYRPNADVVAGGRSGAEPSPGGGMDVGGAAPPTQQGPPPGAPAWTPQVNDGLGNPSRGLIGAIAGGLHYIGSMTGLGGQQGALAADPGVQTARQNFATGRQLNGQPLMTKDEYLHDVPEAIGADGLHEGLKHLASMEAIHKFYQYRGEAEKADQMSAMMMQVSVGLASEYGKEAVARYYNGDLKGAVEAMNRSKDVIADGTIVKATVNPDGKTVSVAGQNLNGEDLWRQVVAPQAILGAALHTANGSLPWHMYEISAAKYDQRSHDMIAARGQSAQSDQVNEAIGRMGPEFGEPIAPAGAQVTPASNAPPAPQPAQPRPPTTEAQAPAPAIPTLPNTSPIQDVAGVTPAARGGASGAQGTDRNAPATPPIGADTAGGTQPALPGPGPTRAAAAALPSPDAQEVAALTPEAEQAHYQQIVATTKPKYFTDDDRPIIGNRPMNRPEVMDQAVLAKALPEVKAAYKERWDRYTNAVQQNKALMSSDIDGQRRDYSLGINTQRTAQAQREADARAELGRQATDRRAELGRQATDARAAKAEDDRLALSQQAPLSPEKLTMFSRTPQPDSGMTEGSLPVDWYAASPHYATDANGTAMDAKTAKQRMMGDLDTKNAQGKIGGGVGRINLLDNALRTTQAYNQHVGTEELADLVLGGALDKYDYAASPTPVSLKHDAQGKPIPDGFDERYAVRFTRKDDGSGRTIVMTADDYNNMHGITMAMRAKNNAPPIQPPPMAIPTGPGQTNANDLMLPGIQ